MKHLMLFACGAMLVTLSFCKKEDSKNVPDTENVRGSEATISWQDCAFFVDRDMTICFVGADEQRCPCNAECVWEGTVNATLHVTTTSGIDTTITLVTNSNPVNLPNSATIGGKNIRFVNTNITDCADYKHYEKYKVMLSVE